MSAISDAITRISEEIKKLRYAQGKLISPPIIVSVVSLVISCVAVYVAAIQLRSNQEMATQTQLLNTLEYSSRLADRLHTWQKAKAGITKERTFTFEILRALVNSMQRKIPNEFNMIIAKEYFYRSEFGNAISYWRNVSDKEAGSPISRELAYREMGGIAYKKINKPDKGAEWYGAAALLPVSQKHRNGTYNLWSEHDLDAARAHRKKHFGN